MFKAKEYARGWGLYLRGFRWLWSRSSLYGQPEVAGQWGINYKKGWTPVKFLPVYCTTYLASVILGLGVVSLSRWWYDRSLALRTEIVGARQDQSFIYKNRPAHPFSRFMTRALDWAFPGSAHGRHTGPILWGSRSAWK